MLYAECRLCEDFLVQMVDLLYSGVIVIKRSSLNFVVDLVSFVVLLGMTFTALVMKYILPPGSGGRGKRLHGGQGAEHIKLFLSKTRHEWGDVHFYLAIIFLILMTIHIILHWTWIKNYFKSLSNRLRKPAGG